MQPNSREEQRAYARGHQCVAGVDEVGRGCLAGPVVAAAVVFLPNTKIPQGIQDSKTLSAKKREMLDEQIRQFAQAFAVGVASVSEIDTINILNASKLAMVRAIEALEPVADFVLIDGNQKLEVAIAQKSIVGGDRKSVSIAAASIIAKVYRDQLMIDLDSQYPGYAFASNKGYGSQEHRRCLQAQGATPIHRKSFSWTPV